MNHVWVIEVRASADKPWTSTLYVALSRSWARQDQADARIHWPFTRITKYTRAA